MTLFRTSAAVLAILAVTAPGSVLAQQPAPMPGMAMPATPGARPGATAAEGSMMTAMDTMSKAMAAVPMTGDADRDFVAMMLPHHQGAVDMARFELAHGRDPAMLRLARGIVAAQNKEIAEMKAWQATHPAGR